MKSRFWVPKGSLSVSSRSEIVEKKGICHGLITDDINLSNLKAKFLRKKRDVSKFDY